MNRPWREQKLNQSSRQGFTLLEIATVLSILAILASFAIPNALRWIKLSRIDEAKSLLNASAAECLQSLRGGSWMSTTAPSDTTISGERLGPIGYQIKSSDKTCSSFFIEPSQTEETLLYTMGFKISPDGKAIKIAIPAQDSLSLNSCKAWAGVNCGVSPEQQAEWDRQAALAKSKQECNDTFYSWLSDKNSGQKNRWDESTNSCSLVTWAFEGTIQSSQAGFEAAREAKLGKICTQRLKDKQSSGFDGLYQDNECGISTYFFRGEDLNTTDKTLYDAKRREYQEKQCAAAEQTWISQGANGAFTSPTGLTCIAKWKCGSAIYSDEASYKTSSCGAPPALPPPQKICLGWVLGVCKLWQ
jgi:prepilin-type N-terminal cleavage/methylation domain-containing protein